MARRLITITATSPARATSPPALRPCLEGRGRPRPAAGRCRPRRPGRVRDGGDDWLNWPDELPPGGGDDQRPDQESDHQTPVHGRRRASPRVTKLAPAATAQGAPPGRRSHPEWRPSPGRSCWLEAADDRPSPGHRQGNPEQVVADRRDPAGDHDNTTATTRTRVGSTFEPQQSDAGADPASIPPSRSRMKPFVGRFVQELAAFSFSRRVGRGARWWSPVRAAVDAPRIDRDRCSKLPPRPS